MINIKERCNQYGYLRDIQFSAYTNFAKKFSLTTLELLSLAIIFHNDGCKQTYICSRTSTNKQTINEIIKKFIKLGYLYLEESKDDKRAKNVFMTELGKEKIGAIILRLNEAEYKTMSTLSNEEVKTLLELTKIFSENMKLIFDAVGE